MANEALQWLERMQNAVQTLNYDISFVVVEDNKVHPWHWLHGRYAQAKSELEHDVTNDLGKSSNNDMSDDSAPIEQNALTHSYSKEYGLLTSLNGPTQQIVRFNNTITYLGFDTNPYSVKASIAHSPLPELLRTDLNHVANSYQFNMVGKSRVSGFKAQLIRIIPPDQQRFSTWIWLHEETFLPLKSAIVSHKGEVLRQLQVTSFNVSPQPDPIIKELALMDQPVETDVIKPQPMDNFTWQINWVPKGFVPTKIDKHKLQGSHDMVDYIMLSDGLVWFSMYIRDLSNTNQNTVLNTYLTSGAESYLTELVDGFEVTVIGSLPMATAKKLAKSVSNKSLSTH
ncbi:MucB/RseB C-terminal domain-containing protein [Algibacillus agarilyticus]|uniref:MucB/RseB C-terminal domain-containing protein n=1 Tax=Algibacillus agarilyticus TaxID=2234133 RepID=UPI001E60E071|nr:MucB/RseB C-terminal domain-containing protein [Algibacillus agarilyticus]